MGQGGSRQTVTAGTRAGGVGHPTGDLPLPDGRIPQPTAQHRRRGHHPRPVRRLRRLPRQRRRRRPVAPTNPVAVGRLGRRLLRHNRLPPPPGAATAPDCGRHRHRRDRAADRRALRGRLMTLAVEPAALNWYAQQLGRATDDATAIKGYVDSHAKQVTGRETHSDSVGPPPAGADRDHRHHDPARPRAARIGA